MFEDKQGPITHFEWGSYTIEGKVHGAGEGVGKDILLSAQGVSAWHEREGHALKPKMIRRALEMQPEVLIIGNGVNGALKVGKKALKAAEEAGVKLVVLKTPDACREYNRLFREGKKVVLLAHGTC